MSQTPKIFGTLERDVMRILWKRGELSVREVHDELHRGRAIAYTTVMTVMQRLAEKGVLTRRQDGAAYLYRPAADRARFFRAMLRDFLASLKHDFGEAAVASFLDELSRRRKP